MSAMQSNKLQHGESVSTVSSDHLSRMSSITSDQSTILPGAADIQSLSSPPSPPRIHLWVNVGDKDVIPARTDPPGVFGVPMFVILRPR